MQLCKIWNQLEFTKNSNTYCSCRHKLLLLSMWLIVLFLVRFNNFDQTTSFYWTYTFLLNPPILMHSCLSICGRLMVCGWSSWDCSSVLRALAAQGRSSGFHFRVTVGPSPLISNLIVAIWSPFLLPSFLLYFSLISSSFLPSSTSHFSHFSPTGCCSLPVSFACADAFAEASKT